MDPWFAMPALVSDRLRLEPLTPDHAAGYLEATGMPAVGEGHDPQSREGTTVSAHPRGE
ncbi:GNAT family N-acetyltransferase [Catenuloplanes japonicus]|uniref:hypothetical protein n=1 Tax=Catenuloplanes japonicus TaxID=33876 RepID=UPI0012F92540|nr:hypothetical protein [Catenuloplanes japonicus]